MPGVSGIAADTNYRTTETGAAAAYGALIDAGIEVYFRLGESMGGPTHLNEVLLSDERGATAHHKRQYADVAKQVLSDLIYYEQNASGDLLPWPVLQPAPPRFIEIWNEPDGEFYADIHAPDTKAFGGDFDELYGAIEQRLRPDQFPECSATPIGGCGFTRNGMSDFMDKLSDPTVTDVRSKVYEILEKSKRGQFDFVSFHWYSNAEDEVGDDDKSPFVQRSLAFSHDLSRFTEGLRLFFDKAWDLAEIDYPEIHMSEWNVQLPAEARGDECEKNWCLSVACAAFVSAAMTWMQNATIGITRAHFFAGRDPDGGLFNFNYLTPVAVPETMPEWEETKPVWEEAAPETMPVAGPGTTDGYHFKVRPSAIAFFLYSDLAGKNRVPLMVHQPGTPFSTPKGVIDAAEDAADVTAIAFSGEGLANFEFILTNLSDSNRSVNIELRGLPSATFQVTSTIVDPEMPHGGVSIPHTDLEWGSGSPIPTPVHGGRCRPKEGVAEAAIESCLQTSILDSITSAGPAETTEMSVQLQPYGVMRIKLEVLEYGLFHQDTLI